MTYKRKKYHVGDTHLKKRWRVRNRKKDLDQIDVDIKEGTFCSHKRPSVTWLVTNLEVM